MSSLDYTEINNEHLILTKPAEKKHVIEGLDLDINARVSAMSDVVSVANALEPDLASSITALNEYNELSTTMNSNSGRVYSQNPNHSTLNPVNDPISHEYIPRINEAALADVQARLDFQNRVYAYTAVGLISVIIGGIMFNSTK
jgi:hypothetical protein